MFGWLMNRVRGKTDARPSDWTHVCRMLYKRHADGHLYCRIWGERDEITLTTGVVGDEKNRAERRVGVCANLNEALESEVAKLVSAGYEEPSEDSYYRVRASVSVFGLSGEAAEERVCEVEDVLSEYGGWSGNGYPGTVERDAVTDGVCVTTYVFDPALAAGMLPLWMEDRENLREVVVTIEEQPERRTVIWPRSEAGGE